MAINSSKVLRQHFGQAAKKLLILVSPTASDVSLPLNNNGGIWYGRNDVTPSGNGKDKAAMWKFLATEGVGGKLLLPLGRHGHASQ